MTKDNEGVHWLPNVVIHGIDGVLHTILHVLLRYTLHTLEIFLKLEQEIYDESFKTRFYILHC